MYQEDHEIRDTVEELEKQISIRLSHMRLDIEEEKNKGNRNKASVLHGQAGSEAAERQKRLENGLR